MLKDTLIWKNNRFVLFINIFFYFYKKFWKVCNIKTKQSVIHSQDINRVQDQNIISKLLLIQKFNYFIPL